MFTFIEGTNREIYYIKEIPNTTLHYITEDSAFFKMDIKMSSIVDRLQDIEQEYRNAADEFRMIRDVVRELRKEEGE
jgi:archaellum biogenesis protein FlaJ (TadC family)